jgi:hypothetical protein
VPAFSLRQRIREAQRLLRRESRGGEYPWEVDHYLTSLFIDVEGGDVAALLESLPPPNRERLQESLRKYPTTDEGWDRLHWVSGSVSVNLIRAGSPEEYARLEKERWEAEKQRFRRGVGVLRAYFASTPSSDTA